MRAERLSAAIPRIDRAILSVDPLLKRIDKLNRYHGLAWSHARAMLTPARLQTPAAPLALPDARDSKNQSIP